MTTTTETPPQPKPFGFRPTAEDEAMLIALRNRMPGRPTTADVVREALKIACTSLNITIDTTA